MSAICIHVSESDHHLDRTIVFCPLPPLWCTLWNHNSRNVPISARPSIYHLKLTTNCWCRLLGWSAFAGFCVLLIGWPLNNILSRRSVRIQKGILAARDKRMGVLNELIGAVRMVSVSGFQVWFDFWHRSSSSSFSLGRMAGSSVHSMPGIMRCNGWSNVQLSPIGGFPGSYYVFVARLNSVMFYVLWSCAPILVSITSFFVYVLQGNVLDVSTAFTVSVHLLEEDSLCWYVLETPGNCALWHD